MNSVNDKASNEMRVPLMSLRDIVAYPNADLYLNALDEKSIGALIKAMKGDNRLFVVTMRPHAKDDPDIEDLYTVGTLVEIKKAIGMPDNTYRVLVTGISRAMLTGAYMAGNAPEADICLMDEIEAKPSDKTLAAMSLARSLFKQLSAEKQVPYLAKLAQAVNAEQNSGILADMLATNMLSEVSDRQKVLECRKHSQRLLFVIDLMYREISMASFENELHEKVQKRIDKNNHEYYLREQLGIIEEELGTSEDDDRRRYEQMLKTSKIAGEARERTEKEIKRLSRSRNTPESGVIQDYIEFMLELPWGEYSADKFTVKHVREVLDADHYALEDVKKRIIEYFAVRSLKNDSKGPILCLVGAPGVGKTSIARSIARALKRKFCQVSLGGVHDEAEIRGHRRTYVGAMPGRVISAIKQCGSMNPVFLFDEIDKMAHDMHGDPSSAMLEVLDPEQNSHYRDHYIEAPFDLSGVLFIMTANTLDSIPRPLMDRMEIIEVPGYTGEEKLQIARRHLWKKQLKENGLTSRNLRITDDSIKRVIECYTRESGVRSLERQLAAICRKAAVNMLNTPEDERKTVTVKVDDVREYLGIERYSRMGLGKAPEVGVVNGLAWTSVGGEVMPIEAALMPGSGALELTGSLGDVMKESARIAWSFVRTHMDDIGITEEYRKKHDIHIHVPEGATPKAGPSAGIALACAMYSALTGFEARQDIAMTGEISLRGKALPIGGVKEKLLAAYRSGISTVLLPAENAKDLEEIPKDVLKDMDVRTISNANEAIAVVINQKPTQNVKAVI